MPGPEVRTPAPFQLSQVLSAFFYSSTMTCFSMKVDLDDIKIARPLLYEGVQHLNKYVNVRRMLELNQDMIMKMHQLENFIVGMVCTVLSISLLVVQGTAAHVVAAMPLCHGPWAPRKPHNCCCLDFLEARENFRKFDFFLSETLQSPLGWVWVVIW